MTARHQGSLPGRYFDDLYAAKEDPWNFATSPYERAKYAASIAALPASRYRSGLEIGCSIGVFTRQLADRCDRLLAVDVSESAVAQAKARLADHPQVECARLQVPGDWPDRDFDLIVLSEVLYYLDRADLGRLAARVAGGLLPDGDVLMVHWTGATDYPLSGDDAAEGFIAAIRHTATPIRQHRAPLYRLDLLRRRPGVA